MNRRSFVKRSSVGVITALASGRSHGVSAMGANDRIRCGFIGVGNMGSGNLRDFLKCENVEVVAVCDVWQPHVERAVEMVSGKAAGYYVQDNRETPVTLEVIYEYPTILATYSNRILNADPLHNRSTGIAFYG